MKASYYDSTKEQPMEIGQCSEEDLQGLVKAILGLRSGRGCPTLELVRRDGASLSLSTDGVRYYLVWINSLGQSSHSLGSDERAGASLIFDYFGSWSEAPQQYLISLEDAMQCARNFFRTGTPDLERVHFETD